MRRSAFGSLATVAILSCGLFTCTFNEDNGNPVSPSPDVDGGGTTKPVKGPVPRIIPVLEQYVAVGETLTVSVTVMRDTSVLETRVLSGAAVIAEVSDGWLDTVGTDANGRAVFKYTADSVTGERQVTLRVTGAAAESRRFTVTSSLERVQKRITVAPESPWVKADGNSTTTITVTVINPDHNPIVGEAVKFITSKGTIVGLAPPAGTGNSGLSLTNSDGRAQAKLTSTAINDTALVTVYLVSDSTLTAQTQVAFLGVHINLTVDSTNIKVGQKTVMTAELLDGSNRPIANREIRFSLGRGASSSLAISAVDSVTGFDGKARAQLTGAKTGTDSFVVVAAGARQTLDMNVTDLLLSLDLSSSYLQVNSDARAFLIVDFKSTTGTPLAGKELRLVRHYQTIDKAPVSDTSAGMTNAAGRDTFEIAALTYETTMRLQVTAYNRANDIATAERQIDFIATRQMTIRATPTVVSADGTSRSTITVQVKNEQNNPIVGDRVLFSSTAGVVSPFAETDETGRAVGWLQSDRRNTVATVTAILEQDPTKVQRIRVEFSGVEIVASATPRSIAASGTDTSLVVVTLIDAMKNPITGEPVEFSRQQAATRLLVLDSLSDSRGQARCKIVGSGAGVDSIRITAAGAEALVPINYSSNKLAVFAVGSPTYLADGKSTTRFGIRYTQGDGSTAIGGTRVDVNVTAGNMGTIFARACTTGTDGRDTVTITNPGFATTITVAATAYFSSEVTTAGAQYYFRANNVYRIELAGSPEVVGTNGGEARIVATVYDSLGNRVKDAHVSFNMLDGPGGGERILPASAVTRLDGTAETYLIAGTIPSKFREVKVVAGDFTAIKSDTILFTIAGPPAAITIRRDIGEIADNNDGTYTMYCAAIVTDVNGNPVADGTEVTYSLKVTGYRIWYVYAGAPQKTSSVYPLTWEYPIDTVGTWLSFEDLNDNFRTDPGEDRFEPRDGIAGRGEDRNGDGWRLLGPAFEDINQNGIRDTLPERRDYVKVDVNPDGTDKMEWIYADLNASGYWDPIEPLSNPTYLAAYGRLLQGTATAQDLVTIRTMDSTYWADRDTVTGGIGYDMDWNSNGTLDPVTTAAIRRTVETAGGKAANQITYGQSDALRIRVMVNAESQGIVTRSPQEFVLPILEKDYKYFCPRCE